MKQIVSSISDVITNSSSEVFVLNKEDAKYFALRSFDDDTNSCIKLTRIDFEWIMYEGKYETELIRSITGINNEMLLSYDTPSEEEWDKFCCDNEETLEEKLVGKYYVEIEDHFFDADIEIKKAKEKSLYYENLH